MVYIYYKCPSCDVFHFKKNTEDTSDFIIHLKEKHDITEDINQYEVMNICPLTGSNAIPGRGKFWKYIVNKGLDPDNIDYECMNNLDEVNIDNKNKLMGPGSFTYLWTHYFKRKMNKKPLENLIGFITIDLLIILVKVYMEEIDPKEYMDSEIKVDEKVEVEVEEEEEVEETVDEKVEEKENDDIVIHGYTNKVEYEDCISGMNNLDSNSVDIIICDPPYNIGKDFGNNSDKQEMSEYLEWCDKWISACIRILKPNGTLFIYGFSEILSFIRVRININVRWIVWHYTNKVTPSLNFWQRTHESILVCSKEKPHFNRDDVREPYTEGYLKNAAGKVRKPTKGRFSNGTKETIYKAHENGALPRDVIKISALSGGAGKKERVDHPTQKPLELCEKLIKSCMNKEGETNMIIPFAGSGSECVAGKKLGINFIGYEINPEYVDLCNSRLSSIPV